MRTLFAAAAILIAGTAAASARCDVYGNCYNSNSGYNNKSSSTYGSNYRTGSQWQNNYNSKGSSGIDSRGNAWSYDRNSGQYYNYGTGQTRYKGQKY